jgi:hypothetical protein
MQVAGLEPATWVRWLGAAGADVRHCVGGGLSRFIDHGAGYVARPGTDVTPRRCGTSAGWASALVI